MMEALLALVETGQDSPAWITYSNQVDVVVVNGVRKAFLSGISHLLHRVSLFEQVRNSHSDIHPTYVILMNPYKDKTALYGSAIFLSGKGETLITVK